MIRVSLATEDVLSEKIAEKILSASDFEFSIENRFRKQGNGYLKSSLGKFNQIAQNISPLFLLTDLDNVECAPSLIDEWKGNLSLAPNLLFRIAIREAETWILADRVDFANFLGVPSDKIPQVTDTIDDPKQMLQNLVRRYGKAEIKKELLPEPGSRVPVGLGYNTKLGNYIMASWSPARAAENSQSLLRTLKRIKILFDK